MVRDVTYGNSERLFKRGESKQEIAVLTEKISHLLRRLCLNRFHSDYWVLFVKSVLNKIRFS